MKDRFLPFCLGILFGWKPFNYVIHAVYISGIIGAFYLGKKVGM